MNNNGVQLFPAVWPHATEQTFLTLYVRVMKGKTEVIIHPDLQSFIPNSELQEFLRIHIQELGLKIALDANRPGIMLFYEKHCSPGEVKHAFASLLAWSEHSAPEEDVQ